jgi:hypothetical protein
MKKLVILFALAIVLVGASILPDRAFAAANPFRIIIGQDGSYSIQGNNGEIIQKNFRDNQFRKYYGTSVSEFADQLGIPTALLKAYLASGYSPRQVAKVFGYSNAQINNLLDYSGYCGAYISLNGNTFSYLANQLGIPTAFLKAEIANGFTVQQVAKKQGFSNAQIDNILSNGYGCGYPVSSATGRRFNNYWYYRNKDIGVTPKY